jgi:nitrite reductase (NAD(P)H)
MSAPVDSSEAAPRDPGNPILTQGVEPNSGGAHSPPIEAKKDHWDMKGGNISNADWNDAEANKLPEKVQELESEGELPKTQGRKRVVVVGLGMVGVAFM